MSDQPFYAPNGTSVPRRQPKPGERVWDFRRDHLTWSCELRFHGESYGWEAQILRKGELVIGRVRSQTTGRNSGPKMNGRQLRQVARPPKRYAACEVKQHPTSLVVAPPRGSQGAGSVNLADQMEIPASPPAAKQAPSIPGRGIAPVPIGQGSVQVRPERDREALTGLVKRPRPLYFSGEPWLAFGAVHDGARHAWAA